MIGGGGCRRRQRDTREGGPSPESATASVGPGHVTRPRARDLPLSS
jgi:hypothetical protein